MDDFPGLGLSEPISKALSSFGFGRPTPVQAEAIPILLGHRDLLLESETGTGKTFAYLAPALQALFGHTAPKRGACEPGVVVVAPTQELAVQIGREAERLAAAAGMTTKVVVLLGGTSLDRQISKLRERPELVVSTLGRLHDLVALRQISLSSLKVLVMDEADRLFANETEEMARTLLKGTPRTSTRVLVSATIPEKLRRELRPLLRDTAEISMQDEAVLAGSIEHWCFYCDGRKRLDFLRRFEAALHPSRCLVFVSLATRVELIGERLADFGLPVAAIHAGLEKEERRVALERFAQGELRYLVTSDLSARGLDILGISHVVSLDLPEEPTIYVHRAGRTGRAGAAGVSIVLADGVELSRASKLAVRSKFVFRCKFLEGGAVLEPSTEEFFARAGRAEEARMTAKAERRGEPQAGMAPASAARRDPSRSQGREDSRSRAPEGGRGRPPGGSHREAGPRERSPREGSFHHSPAYPRDEQRRDGPPRARLIKDRGSMPHRPEGASRPDVRSPRPAGDGAQRRPRSEGSPQAPAWSRGGESRPESRRDGPPRPRSPRDRDDASSPPREAHRPGAAQRDRPFGGSRGPGRQASDPRKRGGGN